MIVRANALAPEARGNPAPGNPAAGNPGTGNPGAGRQGTGRGNAGRQSAGGQETGRQSAGRQSAGKPTPAELGIDPAALAWHRSGDGEGSVEVAFPLSSRWTRGDWVLLRVAGDTAARVLVFDRNEWTCFIDGVRNGEFNDAADS